MGDHQQYNPMQLPDIGLALIVGPTLSIQNLVIPSMSLSLFLGFTMFLKKCLSSCQSSSIGVKCNDSGGVFHWLMPFSTSASVFRIVVLLEVMSI